MPRTPKYQRCQDSLMSLTGLIVFSANGTGTAGYPHAEEWPLSSDYIQKLTPNGSCI